MDLTRRWQDLWRASGAQGDGTAHGTTLIAAWQQSHRHYHTSTHLTRCLADLDHWRSLADHPLAVEWALWFHDAIYDPSRSDNEERSALWASEVSAAAGLEWGGLIAPLIAATNHHGVPASADARLVVDLDLEILAADAPTYTAYAAAVRKEYPMVSDTDFRRGRSAVLRSFLERPSIYSTPAIHDLRERVARSNLRRELLSLEATL